MKRLENKIAIVTGAGKGIGKLAALAIAKEGATVVVVSRTKSDLDQTVAEIEADGGKGLAVPADLTDSAQVQNMVDTVMEKYGRIDILINNAGGYPKEIYKNIEHQAIKIWDWTEEQWDQIIKTNLKPPFLCTNKIAPIMMKQGSGDIVNVSSRMGRITDGRLRSCKGRNRDTDKDLRHPAYRLRHPGKLCCSLHRRYSRAARIQSFRRTGRLLDGRRLRRAEGNALPALRRSGTYDRPVHRPVQDGLSIKKNTALTIGFLPEKGYHRIVRKLVLL